MVFPSCGLKSFKNAKDMRFRTYRRCQDHEVDRRNIMRAWAVSLTAPNARIFVNLMLARNQFKLARMVAVDHIMV